MKIPYRYSSFPLSGGWGEVGNRFASVLSICPLMCDSLLLARDRAHISCLRLAVPCGSFPAALLAHLCSPAVGHASDSIHLPSLSCQPEFMSFFLRMFQSILQKSQPTKEHFKDLLSALCKSQLK